DAGCRLWRNPPPFNHAKLMTVDGSWCLIGSANWDMRSFRLNFELNMEVYHSDLVGQIDALLAAYQRRRITAAELDRRSLPIRLRDNAARLMLADLSGTLERDGTAEIAARATPRPCIRGLTARDIRQRIPSPRVAP